MWHKKGNPLPFWSITKDEDFFSIPGPQSPPVAPFDFSACNPSFGWQDELYLEGSSSSSSNTIDVAVPLATSYLAYDPLYWPLIDLGPSFPTHFLSQGFDVAPDTMFSSNMESTGNGVDQEMKFEESIEIDQCNEEDKRKNRKERSESVIERKNNYTADIINNSKMTLTREDISPYFYMPITVAAKELNVGLTLLKKRCRELGIRRWPHRKLKSLQTLIKNVQAMGKEEMNSKKVREAIEVLAYEQRLMEERPDLQLEDKTKRLRQACFKANYKKRKLMTRVRPVRNSDLTTSSISSDGGNFYVENSFHAQG